MDARDLAQPPVAPRRQAARRFAWAVGGLMLALAAAYTGFWFYAAGLTRDAVTAWVEARRAQGYQVSFDSLLLDGYPLLIRVTVEAPAVVSPPAAFAWDWKGPTLVMEAQPWDPDRVSIHVPGDHRLVVVEPGRRMALAARSPTVDLAVTGTLSRSSTTLLHAEDLEIAVEDASSSARIDRVDALVTAHAPEELDHTVETLDIDLTATGVVLATDTDLPLGKEIARAAFKASLLGDLPPAPVPAQSLALWRDDGGTVDLKRLDLAYGPLTVRGEGTAALNRALQPMGAFTARIEGFNETVEALQKRGLLRDSDAASAKFLLGALALRKPTQPPSIDVAVTIQEQRLFVGPVALLTLPEVRW
jgi:hypothetical protein